MSSDKSPKNLFIEAIEREDPVERACFLDEACGADTALRERVEKLLRAHHEAGGFLSQPSKAASSAPTPGLHALPLTEQPGDRIGRYKLLQKIGEGGCGVVYMAGQEEPVRRRVALKVIKLGMDTRQVIARFEAERQALALMDHPHIARVLDAGATETGRPYFVMELVRGIKITDFCDEHELSTEERLKLFIQVCQAIQHAHQKGVIHRDIKPSNILVTVNDGVPVPKVIDFGIAKATAGRLTDQTLFTAFEQFIGTPAYMSPEQAVLTSLDIDTRSDIYSLGVLLYELLTGSTPFDQKELLAAGLDEMRRTIREKAPPRPSNRLSTMAAEALTTTALHRHTEPPKLIHMVRGDLDWIVMKCLEKDRTRRYETANALAADVRRHLEIEPVVARPPSRFYEFQKTVKRHKIGFAAGATVILALATGLGVSTWTLIKERQARERAVAAEREQDRLRAAAQTAQATEARLRLEAETEAARSAQVAQFMKDMLQGVGPSVALGRNTDMLREILDQTAKRLDALKGQPAVEADLRATLGNVYLDLGEYAQAIAMHNQALALRKEVFGADTPETAASLNDLGQALYQHGRFSQAEQMHTNALALRRKLFGSENLDVAESLNNLAETLRKQNKSLFLAEALHREALATRRKLLGDEHLELATSLFNLGSLLWRQGQYSESESAHREALAIRRKLLGSEHPQVAASLDRIGLLLYSARKLDQAETIHREALAMRRQLLGGDHPEVAHSLQNLSFVLSAQGRLPEAEPLIEEALAIRRKRLPLDHMETVRSFESLMNNLSRQGKPDQALTLLREELQRKSELHGNQSFALARASIELGGQLIWQANTRREAEQLVLEGYELLKRAGYTNSNFDSYALAVILQRRGNFVEAERYFRQAVTVRRRHEGQEFWLSSPLKSLIAMLQAQSRDIEVEALYRDELAYRKATFGLGNPYVDEWTLTLADFLMRQASALLDQGNFLGAEPVARECLVLLENQIPDKIPAAGKPRLNEAAGRLVRLYEAANRPDEAAKWKQVLAKFHQAEPTRTIEPNQSAIIERTDD